MNMSSRSLKTCIAETMEKARVKSVIDIWSFNNPVTCVGEL